jgi:hypothetical protein
VKKQYTLPIAFFVVAAFLVAGNVIMMRWSIRLPYRQKLEAIRTAQSPKVLFIGNSLLDGRVDSVAFEQGMGSVDGSAKPLDAALGGSDPHVQALLMDYSLRCHPELNTLIVGFFDFQLTAEDQLTPTDLTGNASVGVDSRFPLDEVAEVYHFTSLEMLEVRLLRILPMVAYRKNAWKYVELLRRRMSENGMPHEATNVNGRVADFASLEAGTPEHFDQEVVKNLMEPHPFNESYEKVFAEAKQHHMRVVVVMMPMSPSHRSLYYSRNSWKKYWTVTREHLLQRGFDVIDASEWIPQKDQFVDTLHMTPAAATEFSRQIGKEIAQN